VWQEDAVLVTRFLVVIQREGLACNQIDLGVCKFADAQLWTLKVGQNADGTAIAAFNGADALDEGAHHIMAGVAHIDAEEICACLMELLDHRFIG
jgi:hypothetical protein